MKVNLIIKGIFFINIALFLYFGHHFLVPLVGMLDRVNALIDATNKYIGWGMEHDTLYWFMPIDSKTVHILSESLLYASTGFFFIGIYFLYRAYMKYREDVFLEKGSLV